MRRELLSGMGGFFLAVVLYEGAALVSDPTLTELPAVVRVQPGVEPLTSIEPGHPPSPGDATLRSTQAELDETRQRLLAEKFAGDLLRGQLARHEGRPSPWPDEGVPRDFEPDHFEDRLTELLAAREDLEVHQVDCAEYPCIAVLRYTGETDGDWAAAAYDVVQPWIDENYPDGARTFKGSSSLTQNGETQTFIRFSAHARGAGKALGERTSWRSDQLFADLHEEVMPNLPHVPYRP